MKRLLQILLGGTAVFMAVAVAQEWRVFGPALLGRGGGPPPLPAADQQASDDAVAAVRAFVTLYGHLHSAGGDPRFAERLPASPETVQEVLDDIAYLQHRGLAQDHRLAGLEVISVEPRRADSIEVRTKEYWIVASRRVQDGRPAAAAASSVGHYRYLVDRASTGWRVTAWESVEPPAPTTEPG